MMRKCVTHLIGKILFGDIFLKSIPTSIGHRQQRLYNIKRCWVEPYYFITCAAALADDTENLLFRVDVNNSCAAPAVDRRIMF